MVEEHNSISPVSFLRQATKSVPAVKYALGVGGIVAVIAIIKIFGVDLEIAALGTVIMFVLMALLVIFARVAAEHSESEGESQSNGAAVASSVLHCIC